MSQTVRAARLSPASRVAAWDDSDPRLAHLRQKTLRSLSLTPRVPFRVSASSATSKKLWPFARLFCLCLYFYPSHYRNLPSRCDGEARGARPCLRSQAWSTFCFSPEISFPREATCLLRSSRGSVVQVA